MPKRFDTEPDTPGDDSELDALSTSPLEAKLRMLEAKIAELEDKIAKTMANPAFRNGLDPNDASWIRNEKSLGRIAGTIPAPIITLEQRLEDDVS